MYRNSGHRPGPNTPFVSSARDLANKVEEQELTGPQKEQIKIGQGWAVEMIAALRSGDTTPHLLKIGLLLASRSKGRYVLAGFMDELSQAIAEGIR